MKRVLIGLGGNVGNVRHTFEIALGRIDHVIGTIVRKSAIYRTEPWGKKDQDDFLNMAIEVATMLSPEEILAKLLLIEQELGRIRESSNQYGPRSLDMDILFYEDLIIQTDHLVIPHPKVHERNFVLMPLMDITPDFYHPILQKKISELSSESPDTSRVQLVFST